jgi:hypothetical protein
MPVIDKKTGKPYPRSHERIGLDECANKPVDDFKLQQYAIEKVNGMPTPAIQDLLMYYEGDKAALARDISERTGVKYTSAQRNVNRWLQGRQFSRATQAKLKGMVIMGTGSDLTVHIKGCVCISSDCYFKEADITIPADEVPTFLRACISSNELGYMYLNAVYMENASREDDSFAWKDNVQIS